MDLLSPSTRKIFPFSSRKHHGFTLIEILVSIIVLAIGLLGVAALQAKSISFNYSAQLRAIAVAQGNNMLDRMKANPTGVKAGAYNAISGTPSMPGCSSSCSTSQIAQMDAYQWNSTNAQLLPSGQGTVVFNGNRYLITVRWDGNKTGATGLSCSGNESVDLSCFQLEVQL